MAKKKDPPIDGLGSKQVKMIRKCLRQAWMWSSDARRIVLKRCKIPNDPDGMSRCENKKCKRRRVIAVKVDHIYKCGDVLDPGYIRRAFCPSEFLQGLCKKCHDKKTRKEREEEQW